jgi:hypothetical protein
VIELGIVEAVEQVDRAGAGGGEADAGLAGELGVRAGHEGRHLFVADLDESHGLVRPVDGAHDSVDAVARIAVDALHAPLAEALDEEVGCGLCHGYATQHVAYPNDYDPTRSPTMNRLRGAA